MPLISSTAPPEAVARQVRLRRPLPEAARSPVPPGHAGRPGEIGDLGGRRSVRSFQPAKLHVTDLRDILDLAEDGQARQWGTGHAALSVLIAAYGVDGLEHGLYRHENNAESHHLGGPPWLDDLPARYTAAPALLLICGNVRRAGAAAYGALMTHAGALGYAIWLAARARGMDCSVYGGASPEPAVTLRGLDPGSRHLFTVAVGYALSETP